MDKRNDSIRNKNLSEWKISISNKSELKDNSIMNFGTIQYSAREKPPNILSKNIKS